MKSSVLKLFIFSQPENVYGLKTSAEIQLVLKPRLLSAVHRSADDDPNDDPDNDPDSFISDDSGDDSDYEPQDDLQRQNEAKAFLRKRRR